MKLLGIFGLAAVLSWNECSAFTRTTHSDTSSSVVLNPLAGQNVALSALGKNRPRAVVTPSRWSGRTEEWTAKTKDSRRTTMMMMMMDGSGDWLTSGVATAAASMSSVALSSTSGQPLLTEEDIALGFKVATFGPQLFWLLLILLPNAGITKRIMGGYEVLVGFSLVHFFIVTASLFQDGSTAPMAEFANVFDFDQPAAENQAAMSNMFTYPNFVAEEWSHVLTWDLFVGRWIWLDGLRRDIFTIHSVLLCNLIGPPGFLLHILTCLITGKAPFPPNQALDITTTDNDTNSN